ncbi:ATP-grasp domain-containing protein [Thiotrichales bacterium 19S3-7]|nr:ATP-grasp domain-containing protein [Thiotrichales bacterium 19S3-7]MCF6802923.1 ATP-grasp domain-containing protein [Thiotrichales bacterium 19S3-11]
MNNDYVVIVDAFSGGKYLTQVLSKAGFHLIHLLSEEGAQYYKGHPESVFFVEKLDLKARNIKDILTDLSKYNVKAVVPGCESGVYTAELLSNKLSLPSNEMSTSQIRRDKALMQQAIKSNGLKSIKEQVICEDSINEILSNFDSYPAIIKTIDEGASINVYMCTNKVDAFRIINKLINSQSVFGKPIKKVLIQEKLNGIELIVNTISTKGSHFITDIWKYEKTYIDGGGVIADLVILDDLSYSESFYEYVYGSLDAVGISNGLSHMELFNDNDSFTLVEVGARIMGGDFDAKLWNTVTSLSQAEALSMHLKGEHLTQDLFYKKANCCLLLYPSYTEGVISEIIDLGAALKNCTSVHKYECFAKVGDYLQIAKDDRGPYIAMVILINTDEFEYRKDLEYAKTLRKQLVKIS